MAVRPLGRKPAGLRGRPASYVGMVELKTGEPTVIFRLEQERRRCTRLAQRETLLRADLEDYLAAPALADRLEDQSVTVLEEVAWRTRRRAHPSEV